MATPRRWHIHTCTGLCSLGATIGLTLVLHELNLHSRHIIQTLAGVGVLVCLGLMLGLWIPRRLIRQQFPAHSDMDHPSGVELEFAASLTGSLLMLCGVCWLLLAGVALGLESYRAFLVEHFVHPAWLAYVLVQLPICVGLVVAAAVSSATLTAGRGWYRLSAPPRIRAAIFWSIVLVAAALGGLTAAVVAKPAALAVMAALPIFVAGGVAVYRPPRGVGTVELSPIGPAGTNGRAGLVLMSAACFSAGLAWTWALPDISPGATEFGQILSILATGLLVGALGGAAVVGRFDGSQLTPFMLLISAAAWVLPSYWITTPASVAGARLALTGGCAAACAKVSSHQSANPPGTYMRPRVHMYGLATGSCALAFILAAVLDTRVEPASLAVVIALVTTAVVGLVLLFATEITFASRVWGLLIVAAWLTIFVRLDKPANVVSIPEGRTQIENPAIHAARMLYEYPGAKTVRAHACRASSTDRSARGWDIDLGGPRYAIVTISGDESVDRLAGRRLIRRCANALVKGGHLVIEPPVGTLGAATLDYIRQTPRATSWRLFELTVTGPENSTFVLLAGSGIPAWIESQLWPAGFDITMREIRWPRELDTRPGPASAP
ncbi:MAG: hypothetical protein ABIG44_03505 [Planctomycetota bacterium]